MHLCFVFRGTPGLFRARLPFRGVLASPKTLPTRLTLPIWLPPSSTDFHTLPTCLACFRLPYLDFRTLPGLHKPPDHFRSLPTPSRLPRDLHPFPQIPFAFRGSFPTAPGPFFSSEIFFFSPWLPLKRKVAATPLLTSSRLLIRIFCHLLTLSCTFLGLLLRSLVFCGSPAYSDPCPLRFSCPTLRFAPLKHF